MRLCSLGRFKSDCLTKSLAPLDGPSSDVILSLPCLEWLLEEVRWESFADDLWERIEFNVSRRERAAECAGNQEFVEACPSAGLHTASTVAVEEDTETG